MPKNITAVEKWLKSDEILELLRSNSNPRIKERLMVIYWSLEKQLDVKQIADLSIKHVKTIRRWIKDYNKLGFEGLSLKSAGGRPTKLTETAQKKIFSWIEDKSPHDFGYMDQVWTCPVLAAVLLQETGIEIHSENIRMFLKKNDYSFKKPEIKHPKFDEAKKNNLKRNYWFWKKK